MGRDVQYEKDKKDDKREAREARVKDRLENFILSVQQEFWEDTPSFGLSSKYREESIDMIVKALKHIRR